MKRDFKKLSKNIANTMTWSEVVLEHGTVGAIAKKDNKIQSILCGGTDYADQVSEDFVLYHIPKRKYYRSALEILRNSKEARATFKVYQKLAPDSWRRLGNYRVESIEEAASEFLIKLEKHNESN
jgi:hypothetical protein